VNTVAIFWPPDGPVTLARPDGETLGDLETRLGVPPARVALINDEQAGHR
jgi:hypothetical protein